MLKMPVLAFLALFLCGCTVMLIGAGAAGGYAASKDYIEGMLDKDFGTVWSAAQKVADEKGVIQHKFINPSLGHIDAKAGTASLEIDLVRITAKTLKLRVRSRQNLLPNISLAQDVYNRILQDAQ